MEGIDRVSLSDKARAASLIFVVYEMHGIRFDRRYLADGVLEAELGSYSETVRHAALFRFLDEAIFLLHLLYSQAFWHSVSGGRPEHKVLASLLFSAKQSACAIRILQMNGLDGPSRQNLRFLKEALLGILRAPNDERFSYDYLRISSPVEANQFWHSYFAKTRTERFLLRVHESTGRIPYLLSSEMDKINSILGAGAHPNHFGIQFGHQDFWVNVDHSALGLAPQSSSAFVLSQVTLMVLSTLSEVALANSVLFPDLGPLSNNPLFINASDGKAAAELIGKASGTIFLMLIKFLNRSRPDFDPEEHY